MMFETVSGFDGDQNVRWQYVTKFRKTTGRNSAPEGVLPSVDTRFVRATPPAAPETTEQMPPEPPPELPDVEDVPQPTENTVQEGARVPGRWSARHKPSQ